MSDKPTTVAQYLKGLPKERRDALQAIRKVINDNLDRGFKEGIQYGMPSWFVPHSVYPAGYHCDPKQPLPYVGLASQKNHMGLYLFCVYAAPGEWESFRKAWLATGRKLDMGKSCVRFKKLEDVPLDVVGDLIKRTTVKKFVAHYESAIGPGKKTAAKKTASKKKAAKKTAAKKKATVRKIAPKKKPASKKAT